MAITVLVLRYVIVMKPEAKTTATSGTRYRVTGAVGRRLRGEFVSDSAMFSHVGLKQQRVVVTGDIIDETMVLLCFTMVNNRSSMVNIWLIYG